MIYQQANGQKTPVAGRYVLKDNQRVGFALAAYDKTRPLVIDPVLLYSSYLGGSQEDQGFAIAVDDFGYAYVAGQTLSIDFPTEGALDDTLDGEFSPEASDAFVAKLDLSAGGAGLLYATFLGGDSWESGHGIAVDGTGHIYVTGATGSIDFPLVNAPDETAANGETCAFVSKIDPEAGIDGLLFSTYLCGSDTDQGHAIRVDGSGKIYVTGYTFSSDFPTVAAYDDGSGATPLVAAFVAKLDPALGTAGLLYSTYLGTSGIQLGLNLAVDSTGLVYVTGFTHDSNFPTTADAYDTSINGGSDIFVSKLDTTMGASGLLYSTYLGGTGGEEGNGIAVDGAGLVYVLGSSSSANFPTVAALDSTLEGSKDVVVAIIDPAVAGSLGLLYSTFIESGFGVTERGHDLAVDASGIIHFSGGTIAGDVFASGIDPSAAGNGLVYRVPLASNFGSGSFDIALDGRGRAYVTGYTSSTDFPTEGAYSADNNGGSDAFVAVIGENTVPVADAGSDKIVEATGPSGAGVTLDGSDSSDSDGDPLAYTWSGPFATDGGVGPTVTVPLGVHDVTLLVNDAFDTSLGNIVQITVEDTTPPAITLPADINGTAVGLLTDVAIGSATAVDLVDGSVAASPDTTGPFPPGPIDVTWSATDSRSNTGQAVQTVTLTFDFQGFQPTVALPEMVNLVSVGAKIPLRWQIGDGAGSFLSDLALVRSVDKVAVTCGGPTFPFADKAKGKLGLLYDSKNQAYVYNERTSRKDAGACFDLIVTLEDDMSYAARFETQ